MAIDSRCFRKNVSLTSPDTSDKRLPNSPMKSIACSPQAPNVSKASGTNICVTAMALYLDVFRVSAIAEALPLNLAEPDMFVGASVSGDVTSHVRHRPRDQGTIVTPSGRLPSDLLSPPGSFIDEIWARFKERQITRSEERRVGKECRS